MLNFLLSIIVWCPVVTEQPVRLDTEHAQALLRSGVTIVRLYEDGSAFMRKDGALYSGCINPDWGCGD
jgi:hypothetical protein